MSKHFAFSRIYSTAFAILVMLIGFFSAGCQEKSGDLSTDLVSNNGGKPKMTFAETKHDFGKIMQGEKVNWTFDFTNTGDGDLVISQASASCGCTVPEWPKEPI